MLAAVRIRGQANVNPVIRITLDRLMLRAKHNCALLPDNPVVRGMLAVANNWIAWGTISKEVAKKLILKRGKFGQSRLTDELIKEKKFDVDKAISGLESGKTMRASGINPVFKLGPARGGFKSIKMHYPRGSLGKWPDVGVLLEKMM